MRERSHAFSAVLIALLLQLASTPALGGKGVVTLSPATDKILAGDPLHVRVLLHNDGPNAAIFGQPMSNATGNVRFELRSIDAPAFAPIQLADQGMLQYKMAKVISVDPKTEMAAFEVLFKIRNGGLVFSEDGTYDIRAVVGYLDGANPKAVRVVTSEPVRITVGKRPDSELAMIRKSLADIQSSISAHGIDEGVTDEKLARVVKNLQESRLTWTLRAALLFHRIQAAKDAAAWRAAQEPLDKLRKESDEVSAEILSLILAQEYSQLHAWTLAHDALKQAKHRSYHRDSMSSQVDRQLKELLMNTPT